MRISNNGRYLLDDHEKEALRVQEGECSIIFIPDTQILSASHPELFDGMTQWITDHAQALNLKMVLHVGDVVHNGADDEGQFRLAKSALNRIDEAGIPMLIAPGNHDYDNLLEKDRSLAMFNDYFGMDRYREQSWFGGAYEPGKAENMYATLEIDGAKLLFLSLEFGPRDEVLAWADHILQAHEDHAAFIITHCYMYMYGDRCKPGDDYNPKLYPGADGANDGEDMWLKSFSKHANVLGIFSGHEIPHNVSYHVDYGVNGNPVLQSFQNWQCAALGGEGRIRILTYSAADADRTLTLRVYNPHKGRFEADEGYAMSCSMNRRQTDDGLSEYTEVRHPKR